MFSKIRLNYFFSLAAGVRNSLFKMTSYYCDRDGFDST